MPRRCVRPCPWASGKSSRPTGSCARTPRCQSLPPALSTGRLGLVTAPQPTRPRRRHPPEVRRRLILEAARQCILERGLAATTVREIATIADISIGTITYHFESVDEILAEVLRDSSKRFTERVVSEARTLPGAMQRLEFLIDTDLPDSEASMAQFRLWLEYWARAIHDPQSGRRPLGAAFVRARRDRGDHRRGHRIGRVRRHGRLRGRGGVSRAARGSRAAGVSRRRPDAGRICAPSVAQPAACAAAGRACLTRLELDS